jgi:hypothetical protein
LNFLSGKHYTTKKNAGALLNASEEAGLEVNAEKTVVPAKLEAG